MAGYRQILVEAFDPPTACAVLRRNGVTIAGSGPAFWMAYVAEQRREPDVGRVPRLRALVGGGAAKPPTLNDEVREVLGVPLVTGYGSSECPGVAHCGVWDTEADAHERRLPTRRLRRPHRRPRRCAGAGRRDRGDRVHRPDAVQGLPRPRGERGRVHGRRLVPHRRPRHARRARAPAGDRAREGHHHPQGREHQRQGSRRRAVPASRGARRRRGRRFPIASGASCAAPWSCSPTVTTALALDDVVAHCAAHRLARQKIPERIEIVDQLPRNSTGKVLKQELVDRFG